MHLSLRITTRGFGLRAVCVFMGDRAGFGYSKGEASAHGSEYARKHEAWRGEYTLHTFL